MKVITSIIGLLLFSITINGQRPVIPSQNQVYRFLEDASFLSKEDQYNMTALIQSTNSGVAQTSQYLAAQLAFFDNIVFGVDYSKHSFREQRYSNIALSSRIRFNLDDFYHYFNLGLAVGTDNLFERESSRENDIGTTYRISGHYRNYNLTIGGFLNYYPFQNDLNLPDVSELSRSQGYAAYASYDIALSDYFRLTPLIRYNSFSDVDLGFFEGVVLLDYKGTGELAISYKNDYSINATLGAKFFKRAKLSYSYEKALGMQNFSDIHAVGISIDLAAEATDIPEWLANVKKNRIKIKNINYKKEEEKIVETLPEPEVVETVNDTVTKVVDIVDEEMIKYPPLSEDDPEDTIDNHLKPGYYVILGSFKNIENAEKVVARLKSEGFYARIGKKDANDDFNYVYVDRYTDRDIASKRTLAKQKEKGMEKVWLLQIK